MVRPELWRLVAIFLVVAPLAWSGGSAAQAGDPTSRIETRLDTVEHKLRDLDVEDGWGCAINVLFGAFCALWAQNTGRNPWLWFILGAVFTCITVIFLLVKNADDIALRRSRSVPPDGTPDQGEPGPPM